MAKAPKIDRRVAFDALWRDWQAQPEGSARKKRLLDQLVRDNIPLVQKFVHRMARYTVVHCELDDMMQAGLIGLLTAIRKYDPNRPTRFSTMAYPWVRHHVSDMLAHQMPLYRPKGAGMPYKQMRAEEAIAARTGCAVTAEELGVSEVQLAKWRSSTFHFKPLDEQDEHGNDEYQKGGRQRQLADDKPSALEQLEEHEQNTRLSQAIRRLTEVERRIVIDGDMFLPHAMCEAIRERAINRLRQFMSDDS